MRKHKGGEQHGNQERWLLTYADLITLLLVFFVVLYTISKTDADRMARVGGSLQRAFNLSLLEGAAPGVGMEKTTTAAGQSVIEDFVALRDELAARMPDGQLPNGMSMDIVREGIVIRLANGILYSSGRADLRPDAGPALDAVAATLKTKPNSVRVEGHTDTVPIATSLFPSNWELSVSRAVAVVHYFIERGGIAPGRVGAAGYGEFRPVADNATREERARNRRVDILILYPNAPMPVGESEQ